MSPRILVRLVLLTALTAVAVAADHVDAYLDRIDASEGRDRVMAIRTCWGLTDERVVERMAVISREGTVAERVAAVEVLGGAGGDGAVIALLAVADRDDEAMLRGNALEELGRLGHRPAFERMVAALKVHGSRTSAIRGLRMLDEPRCYEPVRALYAERADDAYVYEAAPEALVALDRERAIPHLIVRFRECEFGERYYVARALGSAPDPRVVEALLGELNIDGPRRMLAIGVLAGAGDAATIERLVAHGDADAMSRPVIAHAFGRAPDGAVGADALLRWLRETDQDYVRETCAGALGRLDVKRAAPDIAAALGRTPRAASSVRMLEALATLGDRRAIGAVASVLDDATWIAQNPELSSIDGFPKNVFLHEVAAWALLTLRDGKEPFERDDLSKFRRHARPAHVGEALENARAWWDQHREDDGFSFE